MEQFRYPRKRLDDNQDYLKITCLEYKPPGIGDFGSVNFNLPSSDDTYRTIGIQDIKGTILLPIPDNIPQSSNSTNWGQPSTISPLAAGLVQIGQEAITEGPINGIKSLFASGKKVLEAAQTSIGQKAVQTGFNAAAVGQLLGQENLFNDVLGRQTGAVFNENVELLFRGLNLRPSFQFSFDISPRFKEETEEVKKIIIFLKKEMSAKKGNTSGAAAGLFLTAPSVFKLQYMSGQNIHPFLNSFKICALTDLLLNFTGSNTYATYSDGTPVHMQLTLQFQELTPIYNSDYSEDTTGVGY